MPTLAQLEKKLERLEARVRDREAELSDLKALRAALRADLAAARKAAKAVAAGRACPLPDADTGPGLVETVLEKVGAVVAPLAEAVHPRRGRKGK